MTVRIKLDDKVGHEREHFHAGELSPPVVLDLNVPTSLTLEVDFGANGDSEDRLNWIEPALLKVKPAPEDGRAAGGGDRKPRYIAVGSQSVGPLKTPPKPLAPAEPSAPQALTG